MAFFRKNPTVYSACFVLGIAFGLYSDNPALVSASGLQYFIKLKREGRLQQGIWINTDRFIRASFALIDRICTITFIAEAACKMAGISFARLSEDWPKPLVWGENWRPYPLFRPRRLMSLMWLAESPTSAFQCWSGKPWAKWLNGWMTIWSNNWKALLRKSKSNFACVNYWKKSPPSRNNRSLNWVDEGRRNLSPDFKQELAQ